MNELTAALRDVRDKLRRGVFANEDQVSKGVVMRLLRELGWDMFDPERVSPEFPIGKRKVDYALRHGPLGSAVLIEVKDVGKATAKGEDQLFDYCFREGVPVAVLTDGRLWNFYWPVGRGKYEHRRFAVVDLVEGDLEASAARLVRYLAFDAVVSGRFEANARTDYDANQKRIMAKQAFPAVFDALIATPDPRVVELFADEVERRSQFRPPEAEVQSFLQSCTAAPSEAEAPPPRRSRRPRKEPRPPEDSGGTQVPPASPPSSTPASYTLFGITVDCRNDKAVLVGIAKALGERDGGLYERVAPRLAGRRRRFLAQDRSNIYPGGSDSQVWQEAEQLPGGWWLGTHSSTAQKHRQLEVLREVAGLSAADLNWRMKGKV